MANISWQGVYMVKYMRVFNSYKIIIFCALYKWYTTKNKAGIISPGPVK